MAERPVKLQVRGLGHTHLGTHPTEALRGIDLDVFENEFLVLIGPSGCGKTTLLQIIAGFVAPTRGEVLADGRRVTRPGPDRGYVFQEDAVFPWMTVRANIEFGLVAKGMPGAERRQIAERLVELVGLRGFEDALPKELSGGMLKRVDLARAYAVDPAVLLMDEPFGPLDAQTRAAMQNELCAIWERARKTVVFVTHDIDEAIFLADRIVVLTPRPGRVQTIIPVNLPRPREAGLRLTESFLELKRTAWKAIGFA